MTIVRTYNQSNGVAINDAPAQIIRVFEGASGTNGTDGEGVPVGGTTAQILAKASDTDFDTEWVDQTGGGGGAVDSVNGETGTVVLSAADVGAATTAQGTLADSAVQPGDLGTAAAADTGDFDAAGAAAAAQAASQPLDSDLTAIAALTTTSFGRALLALADAAATRSAIGAGTSSFDGAYASLSGKPTLGTAAAAATGDFDAAGAASAAQAASQPLDSDLTSIAALTTTSYGRAFLALANQAALVALLPSYQPLDSDLTSVAALTTTSYGRAFLELANQAALVALLPSYQPLDSDLTAIAALTTTSYGRAVLALADQAALMALLSASSTTASGIVELATSAETTTGSDTVRAVTPAGLKAVTDTLATLASPTFTGNPLAPTPSAGDNDTSIATTAFVTAALTKQAEVFVFALGDETTAITTGTAKVTWRCPFAFTVTGVRASLTTASSSGIPTVDINEGGTTILSTKLTIDASELTSTTAATAAVISDSSLADDAEITFDIDVAGTGAKGLKVSIYGTRT